MTDEKDNVRNLALRSLDEYLGENHPGWVSDFLQPGYCGLLSPNGLGIINVDADRQHIHYFIDMSWQDALRYDTFESLVLQVSELIEKIERARL